MHAPITQAQQQQAQQKAQGHAAAAAIADAVADAESAAATGDSATTTDSAATTDSTTDSAAAADSARPLVSPGLLSPEWVGALVWSVGTRVGVGAAKGRGFELPDLARALWACAAIGPAAMDGMRREAVNSFSGRSADRLTGLGPEGCVRAVWAVAALGAQMSPKWLNQVGGSEHMHTTRSLRATRLFPERTHCGY
jgi:hypothetical protein